MWTITHQPCVRPSLAARPNNRCADLTPPVTVSTSPQPTDADPDAESTTDTDTDTHHESGPPDSPTRTPQLTARMATAVPADIDPEPPGLGFDVIALIERDHRFCGHCFRQKKDIEEPPEWLAELDRYSDTALDALVGWTWPHEHVTVDHLPRKSREGRDGTLKPTFVCSCGTPRGNVRFRPLSTEDAQTYAQHLSATAWELHYEFRNRALSGTDATAWRHMRIAGALAHSPDALQRAITKWKRDPEMTALSMTGEWPEDDAHADDSTPPYPDPLFRRAFRVAAQRPPDSCLTARTVTDTSP